MQSNPVQGADSSGSRDSQPASARQGLTGAAHRQAERGAVAPGSEGAISSSPPVAGDQVDADGTAASSGVDPGLRADRSIREIITYVPIVGLALYAPLGAAALGFYSRLGVTLEEVELSYAAVLSRSLVVAALAGLVIVVLAAAATTLAGAFRLSSVFDRALTSDELSQGQRRVLLLAAVVAAVGAFEVSRRAQDLGRSVTQLAIILASLGAIAAGLAAARRAAKLPRRRLTAIALGAALFATIFAYGLGGASAEQVLSGDSRERLVARIGFIRWPQPVAASGTSEIVVIQPPDGCYPLLVGSNDGYYVLLERRQDRSSIVRVPVDKVLLRTNLGFAPGARPTSELSRCPRDLTREAGR